MQRFFENIEANAVKILIGFAVTFVIFAAAGIGVGFFTRLFIIAACVAGIVFIGVIVWDTYKKGQIEIYHQPPVQSTPRPLIFKVTDNSAALPDNLLELAGINNGQAVNLADNQAYSETLPPIMPMILKAQRCRILAPQDGGKSTLIQWVVDERIRQGYSVICLDLHNFLAGPGNGFQGKYPDCCDVYGTGGRQSEIETGIDYLTELIENRYDEYSRGLVKERGHDPVYVVVDEMPELSRHLDAKAQDFKFLMMSRARKAHVDYLEAGQSGTAGNSGTKGMHDMNRFDFDIELANMGGKHTAYGILAGKKETKQQYSLPGPYYRQSSNNFQQQKQGSRDWRREPEQVFSQSEPYRENEPIVMQQIGYDEKEYMNTDKQQAIYNALYYSDVPLRAVDIASSTGLDTGYCQVTLSRMVTAGIVIKVGRGLYQIT